MIMHPSKWSRRGFLSSLAGKGGAIGGEIKTGFYYAVVEALLKTGFNEDEISKTGGGNYCRVFEKATAGH